MKIKKLLLPMLLTLGIAFAVDQLGDSVLSYKNVLNASNVLAYNNNYATIQYLFAQSQNDCPPNSTWTGSPGYACTADGANFRGWEIIYFGTSKYTQNITLNASDFNLGCSAPYCDNNGYPYVQVFVANSLNNNSFVWDYIGNSGALDNQTYQKRIIAANQNVTHVLIARDGSGDARPDPAVHWVERNYNSN